MQRDAKKKQDDNPKSKPPKSETPFVSNLGGNVGQNGFQWTRLAELVWMPRASARDLGSEAKFCKISSKTLVVCQILGWKDFYYNNMNSESRKRTRINNGQIPGQDNGNTGGEDGSQVTLEHLTELAERFMNQQKTGYKDAKAILDTVGGHVVRVKAPKTSLGAHGCTPTSVSLQMALDSGAERHVLAGKDFHFAINRKLLAEPIILETANGEATILEEALATCDGETWKDVLMCEHATTSLLCTDLAAEDGYTYTQGPKGTSFQNPNGNYHNLTRKGRLYFLGGSDSKPKCNSTHSAQLAAEDPMNALDSQMDTQSPYAGADAQQMRLTVPTE